LRSFDLTCPRFVPVSPSLRSLILACSQFVPVQPLFRLVYLCLVFVHCCPLFFGCHGGQSVVSATHHLHSTPPTRTFSFASRQFALACGCLHPIAPDCICFWLFGLACIHSGLSHSCGCLLPVLSGIRRLCTLALVICRLHSIRMEKKKKHYLAFIFFHS
jgi:hypothetical protein